MTIRLVLLALTTALLGACGASGAAGEAAPGTGSGTGSDRLQISAGDLNLTATLRDTEAARDLLAQLPLTLTMRDHGGVEKTGPLPQRLSVADEPDGADPDEGDLGYYAPGNDLVLYYGDQSYYDGIVILGRLDGDLRRLQKLAGDLDVRVRRR